MEYAEVFVNETENKQKKRDGPKPVVKSVVDLQRIKLEKLMKNPDKPIVIPPSHREKDFNNTIPSFVRNVMGSSAGAGSGEFHVYRHLRRKEYARQKYIQHKSLKEKLDDEYHQKLENNLNAAEAKTAKKRAKRLKKKQMAKKKGKKPKIDAEEKSSSSDESSDEDQNIEEGDKEPEKIDSDSQNDKNDATETVNPVEQEETNELVTVQNKAE